MKNCMKSIVNGVLIGLQVALAVPPLVVVGVTVLVVGTIFGPASLIVYGLRKLFSFGEGKTKK